jgi:sodium transport system permease protein
MNWNNVKLIWLRELRDQLRDRRTIFTIVVLPVLLYPLLGMTFLRMAQFLKQHPSLVRVIGVQALPTSPPLLADGRFHEDVCPAEEQPLMQLLVDPVLRADLDAVELARQVRREIQNGTYDAVVYFSPAFAANLEQSSESLPATTKPDASPDAPQPEIFVNLANDKSRMAYDRLDRILNRWRRAIVRQNLQVHHVPPVAAEPFQVASTDVSEEVHRRAALWSKLLPFVLLIWALTGAFYPAIDLCAGEKERGTLETLLSSPADRREIVWGKLLTITVFSIMTALLNLLSMGISATLIVRQVAQSAEMADRFDLGPPPVAALGWLFLALIPIAALFSALALAIAAFARSSKEGQYYLMPLLLITVPLMILAILPAAELDLGTSLIPVTGMLLLLRVLIEGEYVEALRFAGPVLGVTLACGWLSIRWAVRQFENESVLFRESERFGLGIWLRHLMRDSEDTPLVSHALFCGVFLLVDSFFANLLAVVPQTWGQVVIATLVTQIGLIAIPVLIMTWTLTRSPRRTLLLTVPPWSAVPALLLLVVAAVLLAIALNPAASKLAEFVQTVYPLGEEMHQALAPFQAAMRSAPLVYVVLLFGLTPAICEELAYRGFILSGLRKPGETWAPLVLSSLLFGLSHGMIQQSFTAGVVGLLIGFLAIRSGSLLPGIAFHFTHNSLSVLLTRVTPELLDQYPVLRWPLGPVAGQPAQCEYTLTWTLLASSLGLGMLAWLIYRWRITSVRGV